MPNNAVKISTLWAALLLAPLTQADTITLRADEWFPFNGEPGSTQLGFMVDIAVAAFGADGHQVDYQTMPWERAVKSVREGQYDCIVGAYIEDAPDFLFPTQEQGKDTSTFFMTAGAKWRYSLEDLPGKRLAVISGYSYDGGEIDAYIEANRDTSKVQTSTGNNALEKNIKMLLQGRVDLVLESPTVMKAKLHEMNLTGKVVAADRLGEETPVYIACSPASPSRQLYVDILSRAMPELRKSGELEKIMNRYGLSDWK